MLWLTERLRDLWFDLPGPGDTYGTLRFHVYSFVCVTSRVAGAGLPRVLPGLLVDLPGPPRTHEVWVFHVFWLVGVSFAG